MDVRTILEKLNILPPRRSKRLNITTQRLVNTQLIGSFKSMVRGRGIEFDGYKRYEAGHDDAKYIDWRASIRSNDLLMKQFKELKDISIMFMLDGGSNMVFASGEKLKLEYAIEIILTIAHNSVVTGDRIGILIHSDKLRKYIPPSTGRAQYHKIADTLTDIDNFGGPTDMLSSLRYLNETLSKNSILFIFSDFIYAPENLEKTLALSGLKFDTICIMINDPRDLEMPKNDVGQVVINSPMDKETIVFRPNDISEEYALVAQQQIQLVERQIRKSNASLIKLRTDEVFLPKLINFFNSRQTKWR